MTAHNAGLLPVDPRLYRKAEQLLQAYGHVQAGFGLLQWTASVGREQEGVGCSASFRE
jgi:hypothetical protein